MTEIKVNPCANGTFAQATYDPTDDTLVIFDRVGTALGYIHVREIRNASLKENKGGTETE